MSSLIGRVAAVVLGCGPGWVSGQGVKGWDHSRLQGSPEPPLPFTTERHFGDVSWDKPIYAEAVPAGQGILVVEEGGSGDRPSRIFRVAREEAVTKGEPVLELPGWLVYGLTFDPDHGTNGFVYLFQKGDVPSLGNEKGVRVSRYRMNDRGIDPQSELVLLEWKSNGHDGGDLCFGADGMLYISTGDGTTDSDRWVSGQTLDDLLGSVLRIDVRAATPDRPYVIPADNPFCGREGARAEIWAYGLRNPWRMTADLRSGQIWVGNNGQDLWETAHLLGRGENYGWSVFEGSHPFYPNRPLGPTPHVAPTIEQPHSEFRSLTGGVVYRGAKWPELEGAYLYGDYSTGRIWAARHDGQQMRWHREIADTALLIAGFALTPDGDVLVVDHGGSAIHRLSKAPPRATDAPPFPRRLSETGLFTSVREQEPASGVLPYEVNAPAWNDGAMVRRWMAVPGQGSVGYADATPWVFPDGSALVQTLSVAQGAGGGGVRPLETRVLLREQGEWAGYSYRWEESGEDAVLVAREGEEVPRSRPDGSTWRIPSRSECAMCHSRAANYVLGITGRQLNRAGSSGEGNQVELLHARGFFSNSPPSSLPPPQVSPYDGEAELEERARSYLHTNCSVCHVESGGGNALLDLRIGTPRDRMHVFEARPQHATFGLPDAMVVAPGDPDRSVLIHRVSTRGSGQMPPLGTGQVDEEAVRMLREWIGGMESSRALVREWRVDEFAGDLADLERSGRDYLRGREAFRKTGCVECHRLAGEGGSVGPDLSGVGSRLSVPELLEAILEPSKRIADGFAVPGTDPPLSTMPAGMVDTLTKEEVLDLLYYLKRDGRPRVAAIVTEYRHNSHADIIVSRLLQTDTLDGKGKDSPLELVSLYTDQVPESDTSRMLSASHRFPIFPTIREALTLGTGHLAVDGVLLIAEHGNYPKSTTGNTEYPKRRFWDEVLEVCDASGRVVPVFVDKHLADNWADAKHVFDSAAERGIPLMAGSSLPTTWRRPEADVPRDVPLREIVALTFHTTDAYGFHALEIVQALAEQRRGGETGVQAVRSLAGDEFWAAFEEPVFDRELFEAAWSRLTQAPDLDRLRERVRDPRLFTIEYRDGMRAHLLELNGAVNEWTAAWRFGAEEPGEVGSSLFWTQEGRPGMHFTWLLNGVEHMILTGTPSWNPERTLYTSGILDALLISLQRGGGRLETPYLRTPYQSTWRWSPPPPPPPMRPWAEQ